MRQARLPLWAGELIVLGAAGGFLLWATRDLTFLMDEWDFVQGRLAWRVETFLFPHNQHLLALDVLLYKLLFVTVGIGDYLPYRLMAVLAHLLCAYLLFEFARRRIGTALAAALVAPVLVLGSGRFVVVFPFNVQWTLSLAALIGILFLLERSFRGRDLAICALLFVAIAASSLGIPIAVGVLAVVLLDRHRWPRVWVPGVPLALWLAWYADYGADAGKAPGYELSASPDYLFDTAAGGVGGLLGVPMGVPAVADRPYVGAAVHLLALALGAGVVWLLVRRRRRPSAPVVVLLVTTSLYWIALTVTRGYMGQPYSTQYVYVSVVLIALIAAAVARLPVLPWWVLAAAALTASVSVALNVITLLDYADDRRAASAVVTAEVTALEIARDTVDANYAPDREAARAPQLRAGAYLRAVDRLDSSPAVAPAELLGLPEPARVRADEVLTQAQRVRAIPYSARVRRFLAASGAPPGACRRVDPGAGGHASITRALGNGGALVDPLDGQAELRLKRFAAGFPERPWMTVAEATYVSAPRGRAARPWWLQVRSRAALELCRAARWR